MCHLSSIYLSFSWLTLLVEGKWHIIIVFSVVTLFSFSPWATCRVRTWTLLCQWVCWCVATSPWYGSASTWLPRWQGALRGLHCSTSVNHWGRAGELTLITSYNWFINTAHEALYLGHWQKLIKEDSINWKNNLSCRLASTKRCKNN